LTNDRSVRLSAFFDAGAAFDPNAPDLTYTDGTNNYSRKNYNSFSNAMRYSTGMALAWVSPLGPLKFSIGVPLISKPGDHRQIFQFTFGGAF
jgi:outer membrane protein insertion porin family